MEPFFQPIMLKWSRNRYGEYLAKPEASIIYRIDKVDCGSEGKGWLVYKIVPGKREQVVRPLHKSLKRAKEHAEVQYYWDRKLREEESSGAHI